MNNVNVFIDMIFHYIWDTTFLLNPSRVQKQHPKTSHNNLAGGFEHFIVPFTLGNDPI